MKWKALSLVIVLVACCSSVNAQQPHWSKGPVKSAAHSINSIGRLLGLGWSDGYHARNGYVMTPYCHGCAASSQQYFAPATGKPTPMAVPEQLPAPQAQGRFVPAPVMQHQHAIPMLPPQNSMRLQPRHRW